MRIETILFIVVVTMLLTRVGRVERMLLRDDESLDNGLHET